MVVVVGRYRHMIVDGDLELDRKRTKLIQLLNNDDWVVGAEGGVS